LIDELVEKLLEEETIDGEDFRKVVEAYQQLNNVPVNR
jgi:ATP-dependent Zn protease